MIRDSIGPDPFLGSRDAFTRTAGEPVFGWVVEESLCYDTLQRCPSSLVAGHPFPSPGGDFPAKMTHLSISFDNGTTLYYSDVRQFGWFRLAPTEEIAAMVKAMNFGPEGIGENSVDVETLRKGLARRRIAVKTALLDQKLVAGDVEIRSSQSIMPDHFWIGVNGSMNGSVAGD